MESLDILEEKLMNLLKAVDDLRKDNEALNVRLREKEEEAKGLSQEVEVLLKEKEAVKDRVTHILGFVESF